MPPPRRQPHFGTRLVHPVGLDVGAECPVAVKGAEEGEVDLVLDRALPLGVAAQRVPLASAIGGAPGQVGPGCTVVLPLVAPEQEGVQRVAEVEVSSGGVGGPQFVKGSQRQPAHRGRAFQAKAHLGPQIGQTEEARRVQREPPSQRPIQAAPDSRTLDPVVTDQIVSRPPPLEAQRGLRDRGGRQVFELVDELLQLGVGREPGRVLPDRGRDVRSLGDEMALLGGDHPGGVDQSGFIGLEGLVGEVLVTGEELGDECHRLGAGLEVHLLERGCRKRHRPRRLVPGPPPRSRRG